MIEARNLTVQVGTFELQNVSFAIPTYQYGVLMGKTGTGKTTLLEAICGLKQVVSGSILLRGIEVTRCKPAEREIGFVPQDGALFPALTVREHLEFAMSIRRWGGKLRRGRVAMLAELLQLGTLLDRMPIELSGGERQRVALGRALSFRPHFLCLDEPLSALDDDTRGEMILLLKRVQQETGVTALHVTHNRTEAEQLADYHLHIADGRLTEYDAQTASADREARPAGEDETTRSNKPK